MYVSNRIGIGKAKAKAKGKAKDKAKAKAKSQKLKRQAKPSRQGKAKATLSIKHSHNNDVRAAWFKTFCMIMECTVINLAILTTWHSATQTSNIPSLTDDHRQASSVVRCYTADHPDVVIRARTKSQNCIPTAK